MCDMCQMLIFSTYPTPNTKNSTPSDMANVVKLYHLCPYHCKFATVRTNVVNQKLIFYSTFLSPLFFLFDLDSPFSESVSLSLPSSQESQPVLPLLTIGREQEEGDAEEGGRTGQERRKGNRDFVKISSGGGFTEQSGFDFWFLISLFSLICWVVGSQLYDDGD